VLGYILARGGVDVIVLERHADFFRDFRGDTIHASTLDTLAELGLLDDFLRTVPHTEQRQLEILFGSELVPGPDFSHLPTRCKFIALTPQWDLLNFLAEKAKRFPPFHLMMQTDARDLVFTDGRVSGVVAAATQGQLTIHADLVVGCDGRHSTVRQKAGLEVINLSAPMDVLWVRISRRSDDPGQVLAVIGSDKGMVMLNRGDYWQCAYIIPKGGLDALRKRGIEAFRNDVLALAPFLKERVNELRGWDDLKLLSVRVDRLKRWFRPGLLCIGDAAHAMSPVGGVGVNLAVQDAVAAANILYKPLRDRCLQDVDLAAEQRRRERPTKQTQALQVFIGDNMTRALAKGEGVKRARPAMWVLKHFSFVRRLVARVVGVGFRPEHVATPEATS
jgi:2-polyprenyl-6-methoxyphenol hydroxylase-like FAD-dependent oxidoreductase